MGKTKSQRLTVCCREKPPQIILFPFSEADPPMAVQTVAFMTGNTITKIMTGS